MSRPAADAREVMSIWDVTSREVFAWENGRDVPNVPVRSGMRWRTR
jgi:hypothetical protein